MKNISFYLKIFSFLEAKFSIYLNRRVFVIDPYFPKRLGCLFLILCSNSREYKIDRVQRK